MRAKILRGFSLMEMMIVLLIVAIIAAASAPMVTKKLSRNTGTGDSPWVFTGLNNNIAYLGGGDGQVLIGATQAPDDADNASVYIAGRDGWSHLRFGNEDGSRSIGLTADPGDGNNGTNGRIGISNLVPNNSSILLGTSQAVENNSTDVIAIGTRAIVSRSNGIAIGGSAELDNDNVEIEANFGDEVPTWAAGGCSVAIGQGCVAGEVNHRATSGNTFSSWATAIGVDAYARGECSVAIGVQPTAEGNWSIGLGSEAKARSQDAIAIGSLSVARGLSAIAIGKGAATTTGYVNDRGIAIGNYATATGFKSIAIGSDQVDNRYGNYTRATAENAVAIGPDARATGLHSVAIGATSRATAEHSVAIGAGVTTNQPGEIKIGERDHTVYIPGRLVVGRSVILNQDDTNATTSIRVPQTYYRTSVETLTTEKIPIGSQYSSNVIVSDSRLKNVGDKYTAGLTELKKLDFFHYTFKKDEEKTPHVGVIAQDLQKVFPDAVTKGEDGYLRIRWEDMFYAVINAVKELDNKITEIVQNITDINSTIAKQNQTIEEQQKTIELLKNNNEEQQKLIKNLEKRIEKLEKQSAKRDSSGS